MASVPILSSVFHANVADLYGARDPLPSGAPLTDRQIYRETVASVAARAKDVMDPALHARIDAAQKLVLAGDVALLDGGTAQVASQANGQTTYLVINGTCTCKDATRALDGWCKHRLGAALLRRVQQAFALAEERLAIQEEGASPEPAPPLPETPVPTPAAVLPEAPASVNFHTMLHGRQVQFTLRDSDESRLVDRLEALMLRFPLEAAVPTAPPMPAEGWCAIHQAAMKLNTKEGRTWYSHQVNGSWCKGRST